MARRTGKKAPDRLQEAWRLACANARGTILTSAEISRGDRELLLKAGLLLRLMKGWYTVKPDSGVFLPLGGLETLSSAVFFNFLALYLKQRLDKGWCLSAETSLLLLIDPETVPDRIIVLAESGSTTHQTFPGLTELTIYRDPKRCPLHSTTLAGLHLMSPEDALGRLKPPALQRNPHLIRQALPLIRNWNSFSNSLAQEGRQTAAIRLTEELQAAGYPQEADRLRKIMNEAGFRIL